MRKHPPTPPPALNEDTQAMALYLAIAVRNALEDFHVRHLTDAQMRELNPIIRNALATALYAWAERNQNLAASWFVESHLRMIPPYWEPPVLLNTLQARRSELPPPPEETEPNDT